MKHLAHHSIDCRGILVMKYHMPSINLSAILVKQWLKGFGFKFLMPLTLTLVYKFCVDLPCTFDKDVVLLTCFIINML